jgi:hypothetical protein
MIAPVGPHDDADIDRGDRASGAPVGACATVGARITNYGIIE